MGTAAQSLMRESMMRECRCQGWGLAVSISTPALQGICTLIDFAQHPCIRADGRPMPHRWR